MNKRSIGKKVRPFPIVGIGGSAGGLEAFQELLKNLSANPGMAFVFIMHLAPEHKSMLAELLSRTTKMPLCEAKNRMPIEIDHVYVIPPNKNMSVSNGKLILGKRQSSTLRNMPVDHFFSSLAKERGIGAIGVILSGTATDGTLGAEAIKAEGGITFAQDERSAKYNGMPQSAIDAGCADFVLSPKKIAHELMAIAKHPYITSARHVDTVGSLMTEKKGLEGIFGILQSTTGLDFSHYKITTITRRISRRMALLKIGKLKDYAKFLRENKDEAKDLCDDLLINVTSFFRDPKVFDVLKKNILPTIIKNKTKDQQIRIWVPGCASGEEAYSIAMCILEMIGNKADLGRVLIFATDISERSIARARKGIYSNNIKENVSPERLKRFFTKEDDSYKVVKHLRDMCVFSQQNVFSDPPFSNLDLISCRNMLIYLQPVLQRSVFQKFHYALRPGGFLLLGNSESAAGYSNLFTIMDRKQKIFVKKYLSRMFDMGLVPKTYLPKKLEIKEKLSVKKESDITAIVDKIVLGEYAPCGVLINSDMEVVQFRGHTGRFLESAAGRPSLKIFKFAREGLLLPLRGAIFKAKRSKRKVKREALVVKSNRRRMQITISVIPVRNEILNEEFFLVLFDECSAQATSSDKPKTRGRSIKNDEYINNLEKELLETKEYLQTVIEEQEGVNEEVKSANEEILSSNEELQSTNEELETAKEELQSSNEELMTTNEELQNRNLEAFHLNNDLINLLNSISMPVIMMGIDFTVRRITPQAEKVLNIIPSDIGRPIGKIKLNIDIPDLEKILLDVIETLHPKTFEVKDKDDNWYSVYIRPYRTTDNKIDGVVAIFVDITKRKKAESVVKNAREYAESIIQTMREPLVVLGTDLKVISANRAFYHNFMVSSAETVGRFIYDLGNGQWNIPKLRNLLEDILPEKSTIDNYEIEHNFESIGTRTMLFNARRISAMQTILITVEDVTDRKRNERNETEALIARATAEVEKKRADELEKAYRKLQQTQGLLLQSKKMASLGGLSAGVAHELNNPLTGILGLVRFYMKRKDVGSIEHSDLKEIEEASVYMSKIIKGLTDFAKPSAITHEKIVCNEVIESALSLTKNAIMGKNAEVIKDYEKDLPAIDGDRTQLQQVIVNMVVNALDAMPEKGRLKISTRAFDLNGKQFIEMEFADNGCGMTKDVLDKIFDPFFSTKKIGKGIGLGLSITYSIIEKHGGDILVESVPGKGATFKIRLPVAPKEML